MSAIATVSIANGPLKSGAEIDLASPVTVTLSSAGVSLYTPPCAEKGALLAVLYDDAGNAVGTVALPAHVFATGTRGYMGSIARTSAYGEPVNGNLSVFVSKSKQEAGAAERGAAAAAEREALRAARAANSRRNGEVLTVTGTDAIKAVLAGK